MKAKYHLLITLSAVALVIFAVGMLFWPKNNPSLEDAIDKTRDLPEVKAFNDKYYSYVTMERSDPIEVVYETSKVGAMGKPDPAGQPIEQYAELRLILDNDFVPKQIVLVCFPHSESRYEVTDNVTSFLHDKSC